MRPKKTVFISSILEDYMFSQIIADLICIEDYEIAYAAVKPVLRGHLLFATKKRWSFKIVDLLREVQVI